MRSHSNKIFLNTLLIAQILICVLTIAVTIFLIDRSAQHTNDILDQQALEISEAKMRERVETILTLIDNEREKTAYEIKNIGDSIAYAVTYVRADEKKERLQKVIADASASEYGKSLQVIFYEPQAQKSTLFAKGEETDVTSQYGDKMTIESYVKRCPYYRSVSSGETLLYIFATQDDLDSASKFFVYKWIHSLRHGENGYVWVNEIINYDGGDDYAIRLIHPNLRDSEGMYLSTNTTDVAGNLPYAEELKGIKDNGEIFYTYYFENISDGQMAQKASYAKLYEPFDWVVATGEPLDDIFATSANIGDYNTKVFSEIMIVFVIFLILASVLNIMLIVFSTRRYSRAINMQIEENARKSEQMFNLVTQHSNRIIYEYDIEAGVTKPWDKENGKNDVLAHLYTGTYSEDALEENTFVLPDSIENTRKFFADIHNGVETGDLNLHVNMLDGQDRWYHLKYTNIFQKGEAKTALISVEDVTEKHAQEIAHLLHIQTVENSENYLMYIEADLTADRVEKVSGEILSEEEKRNKCRYSEIKQSLLNMKFRFEDHVDSSKYLSQDNLLKLYDKGERKLESEWKVRFNDYKMHWVRIETILMTDPYNEHVTASIKISDITEEHEKRQSILHRADYDIMTKLLRKDSGEAQIKGHLAKCGEKGGILILIDLDDLKGINDNLGHDQGDRAIISIAEVIRNHFRKDDILIRAGGDEFIAYLPGAGKSVSAVESSIMVMMKKISDMTVGANAERRLTCSIGCATAKPGEDTYAALFKRADRALYHVKRSSKNNFAFYEPEMEQEDYDFMTKRALSKKDELKYEKPELKNLLSFVIGYYQLVLAVDISNNVYNIMEEVEDGVFAKVPSVGRLEDFVDLAAKAIHPDDVQGYYDKLSRGALMRSFEKGEKSIRHRFRFYNQEKYRPIECIVMFHENENKDACDFTLLRWDDEE